jgi:23S rRNA G2069 N7-methylase RlmK/C1962 C5-methylase RlmI
MAASAQAVAAAKVTPVDASETYVANKRRNYVIYFLRV